MKTEQLQLTEQQLYRTQVAGRSQADRILQRLIAAQGAWVPMPELAHVGAGGPDRFCMVHSRAADLRKRGYIIEQRTPPTAKNPSASEYRLVTA